MPNMVHVGMKIAEIAVFPSDTGSIHGALQKQLLMQ